MRVKWIIIGMKLFDECCVITANLLSFILSTIMVQSELIEQDNLSYYSYGIDFFFLVSFMFV